MLIIVLLSLGALACAVAWICAFFLVLMETGKKYMLVKFFLAPVWVWKIVIFDIVAPMFQDPLKW